MSNQSLFCPLPVNLNRTYRNSKADANLIKTVTDRKLNTFSSDATIFLDTTDAAGNPTIVSHIYIKAKNLTNVGISGTGTHIGSSLSQSMSTFQVTDAQGTVVSFVQDGYQNVLLNLPYSVGNTNTNFWIASGITLTLQGTDREVYEVAAFQSLIAIPADNKYTNFDYFHQKRGEIIKRNAAKRLRAIPAINNEPARGGLDLTINYLNDESYQSLINFFDLYPNFAFIPYYGKYPHRVWTAAVKDGDLEARYIGRSNKHSRVSLRILEA